MGYVEIRDGLKVRLQTITGLRAFDVIPDSAPVPCAFVGGPLSLTYEVAFRSTKCRYEIPIRILATRASERAGQEKLDAYLAASGSESIHAAIEGDTTLGGACDFCHAVRVENYGMFTVGDVQYIGADVICTALG